MQDLFMNVVCCPSSEALLIRKECFEERLISIVDDSADEILLAKSSAYFESNWVNAGFIAELRPVRNSTQAQ